MKRFTLTLVAAAFASAALSGCSFSLFTGSADSLFTGSADDAKTQTAGAKTFLESGSIILSHQVPQQQGTTAVAAAETPAKTMAPLIGYFPPANGFVPADNETWMEISSASQKLSVFHGKKLVKEIQGEGEVAITPGDYFLQHKQKHPVWYAPDSYFAKRLLNVPPAGDRLRYRRGALGDFALYPTTSFPIHCAALWTDEVGGLRVSAEDLASLYLELPVGAPIVIK